MSWLAGSWASTTDDALVHALRDGRLTGLRLFVWGLFPSLSGREERVEVVLRELEAVVVSEARGGADGGHGWAFLPRTECPGGASPDYLQGRMRSVKRRLLALAPGSV